MSIKNNCYICNAFSAMIMAYKKIPLLIIFLLLILIKKNQTFYF